MNCNTMKSIEEMVEMRNEALFSFDREKICHYLRFYGLRVPDKEEVFWGGVCKSICNIPNAPSDAVEKAKAWLACHNMSPNIELPKSYRYCSMGG